MAVPLCPEHDKTLYRSRRTGPGPPRGRIDGDNPTVFIRRAVLYMQAAQTNDGEIGMNADFLSIGMVTVIGLMAGTAIGLFIGYLVKTQRSCWADMTGREKTINIALVVLCSAICIAGLAWRFLLN